MKIEAYKRIEMINGRMVAQEKSFQSRQKEK